jgi:hypothetical protein
MPRYVVLVGALALPLATLQAAAAQTCWTMGATQFVEAIAFCASAVLEPIRDITYGPEHMADGKSVTAWCAPPAGKVWIELRIDRGAKFRRLLIQNGYGKSPEVYRNNSRLKTIEISTDKGRSGSVVLPDRHDLVAVQLPSVGEYTKVRIDIVDVYPGEKYGDLCLDYLMPDFEHEEALHRAPEPAGMADPFGELGLPDDKSLELKLR